MVFSIIVFAGILGLYLVAIKRVWQGRSEIDSSHPPAWWPFSLPLWRGVAADGESPAASVAGRWRKCPGTLPVCVLGV